MRVLAALYRTEREAVLFTQPFGVDPLKVTPNLAPLLLWDQLLAALAANGTVRAVVQAAHDQFPKNPRARLFNELLANRKAESSAEPLDKMGPSFDDAVSEPEALLFFDDLTMPIGNVPKLVTTLEHMFRAAPAVCLLRVENEIGEFFGTGFRISTDIVLTNHHVLFPKNLVARRVFADFGYEADTAGAVASVASLPGDVGTISGEPADDWATIKVANLKPEWPIVQLDAADVPANGDLAYILQHPGGRQKRLGFVRNTITDVNDRIVRYLTDTEPGSSGAPVFDALGRIIAIHHAGGRAQEVLGRPPVTKNEGIRASRILERLRSVGVLP